MTEKAKTYTTKTGRVLTDADIEALADEAGRGYDVDALLPRRGRREAPQLGTDAPDESE